MNQKETKAKILDAVKPKKFLWCPSLAVDQGLLNI